MSVLLEDMSVRLSKINHSGPGCSFFQFYECYIFQLNTRVYLIIINNKSNVRTQVLWEKPLGAE